MLNLPLLRTFASFHTSPAELDLKSDGLQPLRKLEMALKGPRNEP